MPLINDTDETLVIDRIMVEDPRRGTQLRLRKAFVVAGGAPLQTARAGRYPAVLAPAACYEIEPDRDVVPDPYVVLRLAPGSTSRPSQNGTVDVAYHTLDGRDWVAVFPYRVRFDPT